MSAINAKEQAREILDRLSPDATWKDIAYEFYVRERIEAGLRDCEQGRKRSMEEVFAQFGIYADEGKPDED